MISSRSIAQAVVSLALTQSDVVDVEKVADQCIAFIQKYKLEGQIESILAHMQIEADKENNAHTLFVETPFPINSEVAKSISSYAQVPGDSRVHVSENRNLLGGFTAVWQDKKIDASLSHVLENIEKTLLAH